MFYYSGVKIKELSAWKRYKKKNDILTTEEKRIQRIEQLKAKLQKEQAKLSASKTQGTGRATHLFRRIY